MGKAGAVESEKLNVRDDRCCDYWRVGEQVGDELPLGVCREGLGGGKAVPYVDSRVGPPLHHSGHNVGKERSRV